MSTDRPAWEYATARKSAQRIPITNEPRPERAAGVPEPPSPPDDQPDDADLEQRRVRVTDPSLDTHTNQRLTGEVARAAG